MNANQDLDQTDLTVGLEHRPEAWFDSDQQHIFQRRLEAGSRRILILDYDGTLAPFHADKMQAFPYPGVTEALHALHTTEGVRLVLVTGRKASDLEQLIDMAKYVEVWGSHGREHISVDRKYTFFAPSVEQYSVLAAIRTEIESALRNVPLYLDPSYLDPSELSVRSLGSQAVEVPEPLEAKPASIAIHWRGLAPESRLLLQQSADAAYRHHECPAVERLPFESGVEFRATGYTKAFAVNRILEEAGPGDVIAYLGDDTTDEDAFAALQDRGYSFLVRPEIRTTHAKYWLRPPAELLRFLKSCGPG